MEGPSPITSHDISLQPQEAASALISTLKTGHSGVHRVVVASTLSPHEKPIRPFSTDFTASALRYALAKSPNQATSSAPLVPQIIIDDFAEPTQLGRVLRNAYQASSDRIATIMQLPFSGQIAEEIKHDAEMNPKLNGFTGLSNFTGICGTNAALQELKAVFNIILEGCNEEQQTTLLASLEEKMPQFFKFLNGECNTAQDCRLLRQEVAHKLAENFWYNYFSGSGIARLSEKDRFMGRAYAIPILQVLLHELEIPPIYFSYAGERGIKHCVQTWNLKSGNELLCAKPQSMQEIVEQSLNEQEITLTNPVPPVLIVNAKNWAIRGVHHIIGYHFFAPEILNPITLPHQNEGSIIFEPKAIDCSPASLLGAHAYTVIHQDGAWHEVNDKMILRIPKAWEKDLDAYCAQYGSAVVYQKRESMSEQAAIKAGIENPEENTSPEEIATIIDGIEKGLGYPTGYFVSSLNEMKERKGVTDRLRSFLLTSSLSNQTFCFQQLCKIYLGNEESTLLEDERTQADSEAVKAFKGLNANFSMEEANEVIQKLTTTQALWSKIITACCNEKENAPSHLKSKWEVHLKRAEDKIRDYTAKIDEIKSRLILLGVKKTEK